MSNAGFSGKPKKSSPNSGDDIPAALRDTSDVAPKTVMGIPISVLVGAVGFILVSILSGFLFLAIAPKKNTSQQGTSTVTTASNTPNTSTTSPGDIQAQENQQGTSTVTTASNTPNTSTVAEPSPTSPGDIQAQENGSLLGHLPYPEAAASDLASISADGRFRMLKSAAENFLAMQQAARNDGVKLVPISAFRSIEEQKSLFFGVAAQRNQTPAQRAAVSAPPGYSEHHTGYAVDIGDGAVPATNLNTNFEQTKAYQWLEKNAAKYYFEVSFPKDNPQGVSYEPWHWRFVGDTRSLEMFYKARNLKPVQK